MALITPSWSPDLPRKPSISFQTLSDSECAFDLRTRCRQQQCHGVLQEFGQNAAGADDERQAELRIGFEPDDEFGNGAGDHALDEYFRRELRHFLGNSFGLFGGISAKSKPAK